MASSRPFNALEVFDVVAPANTAIAAPVEVATPFNPAELVGVELVIPDGHAGLTGIRLAVAHSQVIPRTAGAWIVGNDEVVAIDAVGYPNSGAWSAFVYNLDQIAHTFHLRFEVLDFAHVGPQPATGVAVTPLVV